MPEASPPSRNKEFFKGAPWPFLLAAAGLVTLPIFIELDYGHGTPDPSEIAVAIAMWLTILGSILLVFRWWNRSRARAWGVICGFIALPIVLGALFLVAVLFFHVQTGPR